MTILTAAATLDAEFRPRPGYVCWGLDWAGAAVLIYTRAPLDLPAERGGHPVRQVPIASVRFTE